GWSGQFAKWRMSDGDCGALDVAGVAGAWLVAGWEALLPVDAGGWVPLPLVPQAARNALNPTSPVPWRKRRRVRSEVRALVNGRGSRISSVIVSSGPLLGDARRSGRGGVARG